MRAGLPLVLIAALAGCGQTAEGDGFEPPPEQPLPFDGGDIEYPAGPYSIDKGSVIANYEFSGFANPVKLPKELVTIRLSDFYNPTGDAVYPEGSQYPPGPKPRGLLIVMSAVW